MMGTQFFRCEGERDRHFCGRIIERDVFSSDELASIFQVNWEGQSFVAVSFYRDINDYFPASECHGRSLNGLDQDIFVPFWISKRDGNERKTL